MFVARVARQTKTREYKDLDAHFTANLGYSHHQKSVILDGPHEAAGGDPNRRRIVAFVGGIDLTGELQNCDLDCVSFCTVTCAFPLRAYICQVKLAEIVTRVGCP